MNETYVECLVARKKNPLTSIVKYVLYGIAIACLLMGLLGWFVLFILGIIFGLVAYFVTPMFDLEYEYLYLSKEISIDKVMAKEKRKHVMTIDLNKATTIAPSNSHSLDSYVNREHKERDFSSGEEQAKTYTMVYEDKDGIELIKFEPNEEMLAAIKTVFPRKIVEY